VGEEKRFRFSTDQTRGNRGRFTDEARIMEAREERGNRGKKGNALTRRAAMKSGKQQVRVRGGMQVTGRKGMRFSTRETSLILPLHLRDDGGSKKEPKVSLYVLKKKGGRSGYLAKR